MEFTLGFQSELIKEMFMHKFDYETIQDIKQSFKTQNINENISILEEFGHSYCYLVVDKTDAYIEKHMLFTDEGFITVIGDEIDGFGKYVSIVNEKGPESLEFLYQEIETLLSDVMIAVIE